MSDLRPKFLVLRINEKQLFILLFLFFVLMLTSIQGFSSNHRTNKSLSAEPALAWAKLTLHLMKDTPNGTPTYGSRFVGYTGLTMYECIVDRKGKYTSIARNLNQFDILPQSSKKVNKIIALNSGQARIIRHLYGFTSAANLKKIDSLEKAIFNTYKGKSSDKSINESIKFGQSIADAIYDWSKTDGGDEAYMMNFDSSFVYPRGTGLWTPPAKGQASVALPLHHKWGNNRTFAKGNETLPIPSMITFDYNKDSEYYVMMKEVYDKRLNLSQEEKEIANWWGDDPSETFSPPGHSYYMASIAIENSNADLFKAAKTFASVGMAVADAFINCWKCKYFYNAERPFAFIFYNVSTLWDLYWPEPPFPAFYSGHAGQAASAATVLTNMYGENFSFTDKAHIGRPMDAERLVEYKARKFDSFWAAAQESADSRLYGGIHTRQDNEVGLEEGKKIGGNIMRLFEKSI